MVQAISTNTFTAATYIVNNDPTKGSHVTLASALTSASSGDTIYLQTSVTENITLKAGVNIFSHVGAELTPTVSITGTCTMTTAGTCTISGIRLTTNSDNFLAVTGSAASIVNLENCFLNCSNNTGITFSSSSASAQIFIKDCKGDTGTTGIALFFHSSAGTLRIRHTDIFNTGATTTASTQSAGNCSIQHCDFRLPITTSGTATYVMYHTYFDTSATNTTSLTAGGSGIHFLYNNNIAAGTASSMSVGDNATCHLCDFSSSNANNITGAGTLNYMGCTLGSSLTINTTTKTPTAWPVLQGGTGLTATTTSQLLYSSGTNTIAGLATGNNGVLVTSNTGVPSILAGGTTGQMLQAGTAAAPAFSTSTYPATNAVSTLLYASSANVMAALATANSGVLTTSSSGVPSIDTTNFSVLSTGVIMKGNNTNTAPAAGKLGEQIVATVTAGSPVTLSNGTPADLTSIALTAGIWDVTAIGCINGTLTGTLLYLDINTTSATLSGRYGNSQTSTPTMSTAFTYSTLVSPTYRLLLSGNQTVYAVMQCNFSAGTCTAFGRLSGVRVG